MLNLNQFKDSVLNPALSTLQMYSDEAMELLIFTCAAESDGGTYLKQIKGPALGIFQMEPTTHHDLWVNYIFKSTRILSLLAMNFQCPNIQDAERMVYDIRYAAIMARLQYARFPEPLPKKDDVDGMFDYYKKYYNTAKGKAKKADCIKKYKAFIA
ncbi:MAG: hypothetical protein QNK11_07080 [Legionella sp.]|nr:hypothetical protein [Legionella sp.]